MGKTIWLTYEKFTDALKENGWSFFKDDFSWRPKKNDPLGEPAVSDEALQDICELHPVLSRQALNLLLAGHGFDITINQVGYETTIVLRPSPILVSQDPLVFARPVKVG